MKSNKKNYVRLFEETEECEVKANKVNDFSKLSVGRFNEISISFFINLVGIFWPYFAA